ncbi:MAG: hypothetical protein ABFS45_13095 [Pseudomonadota bacterium]
MNKITLCALITAMSLWGASPSIADVGVTNACQDDIKELQDKINDNKDDYTAESRRKAKNHLLAAKTNRLNPVKCRGNILDARNELQKSKRDKKKKEKD